MSKPATCAPTAHDFEKFDDATIYCRQCGEQRVVEVAALIAQLPQPTYLPCPGPHYPSYPTWTPWWQGSTITYSTSGTTDSFYNKAQGTPTDKP